MVLLDGGGSGHSFALGLELLVYGTWWRTSVVVVTPLVLAHGFWYLVTLSSGLWGLWWILAFYYSGNSLTVGFLALRTLAQHQGMDNLSMDWHCSST